MAEYPPPIENLLQFTPSVFKVAETPLTIEEGKKFFLTFPNAQGTENLATVNISGDLNITSDASYGTIYGFGTTKPTTGTPLHNTAVGYKAGRTLDTLSTSTSSGGNSGFGALSLYNITGAASNNTGLGHNALRGVSTGSSNTQVGFTTAALAANLTTGARNTLIGANASVSGVTISGAVAIGSGSAAGENSTAIGSASAAGTTAIAIGYAAVSGDTSITIGQLSTASGVGSIAIGSGASTASATNSVAIGINASTSTNNSITLGRQDTDSVRLNKITPIYTSLSVAAGDIGYTIKLENGSGLTAPGTGTGNICSQSVGIGVWVVSFLIVMGSGALCTEGLRMNQSTTAINYAGKFVPTSGFATYSGSTTITLTLTDTITLFPTAAGTSGSFVGAAGSVVKFTRLA
jgi:hypothetical protein